MAVVLYQGISQSPRTTLTPRCASQVRNTPIKCFCSAASCGLVTRVSLGTEGASEIGSVHDYQCTLVDQFTLQSLLPVFRDVLAGGSPVSIDNNISQVYRPAPLEWRRKCRGPQWEHHLHLNWQVRQTQIQYVVASCWFLICLLGASTLRFFFQCMALCIVVSACEPTLIVDVVIGHQYTAHRISIHPVKVGSLCGMHKARRLEQAREGSLSTPPCAAWSLGTFGMSGLTRVRGG
jgi:hypothetical protein